MEVSQHAVHLVQSHVELFQLPNSIEVLCDVRGKTVRCCRNSTNLVEHLRISHNKEYDEVVMRQSKKKERADAERVREASLSAGRHYPGSEGENVNLVSDGESNSGLTTCLKFLY